MKRKRDQKSDNWRTGGRSQKQIDQRNSPAGTATECRSREAKRTATPAGRSRSAPPTEKRQAAKETETTEGPKIE